jgi:tRNA threonylcarbamoyladenosine biosynthesis protein TsaB
MPAPLRLLSLEAGGERISAALFEDGRLVASAFEGARQRQTERLAPLVQGLLQSRAWAPSSLGAIAAGRGPGSFTGLRSSLALGQGLSSGNRARLIGVDTLEAWAEASQLPAVAVSLDGRRGQLYLGLYEKNEGRWRALEAPALLDAAEAWSRRAALPVIGDLSVWPAGIDGRSAPEGAVLAEAVGRLAWARWQGQAGPSLDWQPLYLRRAEAEILWEKLHPKAV